MACAFLFGGNPTAQTLASGNQVNLGAAIHGFGGRCRKTIEVSGSVINLNEPGYYEVDLGATVSDSAIGDVTIQAVVNGNPVAVAQGTESIAAANDPANISFQFAVLVPKCTTGSISFVATSTAGNPIVNDLTYTVTKIR